MGMNAINTFDYTLMADVSLSDQMLIALMYFTGYLTIRNGDSKLLTLTFPNAEVRMAFTESLFLRFCGLDVSIFAHRTVEALRTGQLDAVVRVFNAYLKEIQYDGLDKAEKGYQEAFMGFLIMAGGIRASAEESTLLARSDVVIERGKNVWIVEMKVDQTAQCAIDQIRKNGYFHRYVNTDKCVHLVGMNFISEKKEVSEWKEEILDKTNEVSYLG